MFSQDKSYNHHTLLTVDWTPLLCDNSRWRTTQSIRFLLA